MKNYPAATLVHVQTDAFVSFLNLSRWFAAMVVFVSHLRNPLFSGFGDLAPEEKLFFVKIWYFLTGYHFEAVIVFFVLSGFLVGGLGSARASIGQFSLSGYAIDRITRLYVTLLPALLLTFTLDSFGASWFADIGFWDQNHPQIQQKNYETAFGDDTNFRLLVSNALMLQYYFTASLGSNQPLWTISTEFWFYVAFGLAIGYRRRPGAASRALSLGIFLVIAAALGPQFVLLLGLWLVGVIAAFIPWQEVEQPRFAMVAFVAILAVARAADGYLDEHPVADTVTQYFTAISFGWLLVSVRSLRMTWLEKTARFNSLMADFSYSLYLIHFPLLLFSLAALHATGLFDGIARGYSPTDGEGLLVYVCVIVLVYVCAFLFSRITERQTWRARRVLKNMVARFHAPSTMVDGKSTHN